MKRRNFIILIIILLFLLIIVYYLDKRKDEREKEEKSLDIGTIIKGDNIPDIDYTNLKTTNIELSETLTIKKGGVYILTGTINNGQIYIDTEDNVKLILNNVNIANKIGPAIMIENANQVYIELASDSVNYLTDGDNYSSELDEEINATVFSKDDLILGGSGKLVISSHYQDGIVSKDNLKIIDGIYEISTIDDAICGKDSLVIINGNFNLESLGDGLKSTNDKDDGLGYILIENGNFNIKTGNGSSNSSLENNNWEKRGDSLKKNNVNKNDNMSSAKGLKANENIVVNNGKFIIDSSDDSIHSNGNISISNGNFIINSGDDGIHADNELIIDGGNISAEKSYEGFEAQYIIINAGNINIVSNDDGINATSGNDSSSMGRPGMNNFEGNGNAKIEINAGNIYISASGDGIDANGSIYMNGGTVIVNGPTDNGNGAIDYDKEFKITNGIFVGSGSSGMAQGFSNNSIQNSVMINFSRNIKAGELVSIIDSNGIEILTYKANKNYQNLVISAPTLKLNDNYIIYIGGVSENEEVNGLYNNGGYKNGDKYTTFITTSIITKVGNIGNANQEMNIRPNIPNKR